MKRRLRTEIFHRLWGKIISGEKIKSTEDEPMKDILRIVMTAGREGRHKGSELFTNVIAPLQLDLEKLCYGNTDGSMIEENVIDRIREDIDRLMGVFSRERKSRTIAAGIEEIKDRIKGVVAILDGLRYDLWLMLKDEILKEGFTVRDDVFSISAPSSTNEFRRTMGIEDEGDINGKSYILYKWAEKGIGKRQMKKILSSQKDIIFLHFNFIDAKVHSSTLNLYPLYLNIKAEFASAIMPLLKGLKSFYIISDHGFTDRNRMKDRYTHGGDSAWETLLPFAEVRGGFEFEG